MADEDIRAALAYHEADPPGKIAIVPTKPVANQHDLALAYSPGVAHACLAIEEDPATASKYTARANLVGVITNGTAVLGLGNIGPLASKPVMEGKAVLFKKFAGIDCFDIEVASEDVDTFVAAVACLEPTFGGINLEDIKAPECFEIERRLKEKMKIPVFHDDQHGTAIVVASGIINGLKIVGKDLADVKLVASGAGAAALACLNLLVGLGLKRENTYVCDIEGVVYAGRKELMDPYKEPFARETDKRTLAEVMPGADVFLGLSAAGVVKPEMVAAMADKPLIFALANPTPEIMPEEVHAVRQDAVMASGRTDFPNQINNVLCFPFIFRGALDVGATQVNEEMKKAAVLALASIAENEASDIVLAAYQSDSLVFGANYIVPKPFDPRLITEIAPAVARAAMETGVATRPIEDLDAYRHKLSSFVYQSGFMMKPVFDQARHAHSERRRRLVFAEGAHPYVLQAAQQVIAEQIAEPILVGNTEDIEHWIKHLGLRMRIGKDVQVFDQTNDPRIPALTDEYLHLVERRGVPPSHARRVIGAGATVVAGLLLRRGDADAMICGIVGRYLAHLRHVRQVIGQHSAVNALASLTGIILPSGPLFMADTHVNHQPDAETLAEITLMAAEEVQRFGITPKIALLSHSNFGTRDDESSRKMRRVLALVNDLAPDLEIEGEMHAEAAISTFIREDNFPNSRLEGPANLLIMPTLDAAHISFTLLRSVTKSVAIGPMLLGTARPAHILTTSATVRSLLNMSAVAIADSVRDEQTSGQT
ncbi:MAG: NADP-dependent malic enzyme [Hyphomicrobiaceae bacterium]